MMAPPKDTASVTDHRGNGKAMLPDTDDSICEPLRSSGTSTVAMDHGYLEQESQELPEPATSDAAGNGIPARISYWADASSPDPAQIRCHPDAQGLVDYARVRDKRDVADCSMHQGTLHVWMYNPNPYPVQARVMVRHLAVPSDTVNDPRLPAGDNSDNDIDGSVSGSGDGDGDGDGGCIGKKGPAPRGDPYIAYIGPLCRLAPNETGQIASYVHARGQRRCGIGLSVPGHPGWEVVQVVVGARECNDEAEVHQTWGYLIGFDDN